MKTRIHQVDTVRLDILKSNPPKLLITTSGMASTSGWTNVELRPMRSPDALRTLIYELVGDPPTGPAMEVLTPAQAITLLEHIPAKLEKVVVLAKTNKQEAAFGTPHKEELTAVLKLRNLPLRRATGISEKLSFDEAFQDALDKLPNEEPTGADMLTTVRVVGTYALFGGIVGFHELHVEVETN